MARPKRDNEILEAAIEMACEYGYRHIEREPLAAWAGVSPPLISHYYTNIELLKQIVIEKAVKDQILPIVAQIIALEDPEDHGISYALRKKAVNYLLKK